MKNQSYKNKMLKDDFENKGAVEISVTPDIAKNIKMLKKLQSLRKTGNYYFIGTSDIDKIVDTGYCFTFKINPELIKSVKNGK